jgi:hypothetical protein
MTGDPFPEQQDPAVIARQLAAQRQAMQQRIADQQLIQQSQQGERWQQWEEMRQKAMQALQPEAQETTQPTTKDEGLFSNAAAALRNQAANTLRTATTGKEVTKAIAGGDTEQLSQLAAQKEEVTAPQQKFSEARGESTLWSFLPNLAKAAVKEPEGAFDAALQMVASFVPYIAADVAGGAVGSVVPGIGTAAGSVAAVSLTAGELTAGQMTIDLIRKYGTADGINVNDATAVKNWLDKGGLKRIAGPVAAAAATDTALAAISLGVAANLSRAARSSLMASLGPEGPLQPAVVNALRSTAAKQTAGSVAAAGLGFPVADAAAQLVAGETPDEGELLGSALMMTLMAAVHARGPYKELKREIKAPTPIGGEAKAATTTTKPDASDEAIAAAVKAAEEEPAKVEVPTTEVVAPTVEAKKEVPVDQRATEEQVAGIKPFDEPTTQERAFGEPEMQERVRTLMEVLDATPDEAERDRIYAAADSETILHLMVNVATMHVTNDAMKGAVHDLVTEAAVEAKGRVAERAKQPDVTTAELPAAQATDTLVKSAVESATSPAGVSVNPLARTTEPSGNGQVHERTGLENQGRPGGVGGAGVVEEGVHTGTNRESGGGESARGAGAGGEGLVTEPSVPRQRKRSGKAGGAGENKLLGDIEKLTNLGDQQRGKPEAAMLAVNNFHAGLLSPVIEHTGCTRFTTGRFSKS